jgi:hypothetical protein
VSNFESIGFDWARAVRLDFWGWRVGVSCLAADELRLFGSGDWPMSWLEWSTDDLRVAEAYSPDFLSIAKLASETGRPEKLLAGFYTVGYTLFAVVCLALLNSDIFVMHY